MTFKLYSFKAFMLSYTSIVSVLLFQAVIHFYPGVKNCGVNPKITSDIGWNILGRIYSKTPHKLQICLTFDKNN